MSMNVQNNAAGPSPSSAPATGPQPASTGSVNGPRDDSSTLSEAELAKFSQMAEALLTKLDQSMALCLPPAAPVTTEEAQSTSAAMATLDPVDMVYDVFQLMALVLETQMAGYETGSARRAAAADAVDKLRWAAAALKDKSVNAQYKAAVINATFQIVSASVTIAGSTAVGTLGANGNLTQGGMATGNAFTQGVSGLNTGIGSLMAALEQRKAGQADADASRAEAGAGSSEKSYNTSNELMQRMLDLINKVQQWFQQVSQAEIQTTTHMANNV